jgi:hypothetical protein
MDAVSLKACDKCGLPGHVLINSGPNSWTMTSTVYCYSCMCECFPIAIKVTGGIDIHRYVPQEIRFCKD